MSFAAKCRAIAVAAVLSFACSKGSAPCLTGSTQCGATCANLMEDQLNCGACGTACGDTQRCSAGSCVAIAPCLSGSKVCGRTCVDLQTDQNNCGACGQACAYNQRCVSGACAAVSPCLSGSKACGGTCVDVQTDQNNCGDCGQVCGAGKRCVSGGCTAVPCSDLGLADCDGGCFDLSTDPQHCGSCTVACADVTEFCSASGCATRTWEVLQGFDENPDGGLQWPSFSDFTPAGETAVYAGGATGTNPFQVFTPPDAGGPLGSWSNLSVPDGGVFVFDYYVGFARSGGALYMMDSTNLYAYDIASDTWTVPIDGGLPYGLSSAETAADDDGFVYANAHDGGESVLIQYEPADGGLRYFFGPGDIGASEPRASWDTQTRRLYLAEQSTPTSNFYAFDPADGGYTTLTNLPGPDGFNDSFCADRVGHVFTATNSSVSDFWMYTAATNTWLRLMDLPFPHGDSATCTITADGWLYFGNGNTGQVARYKLR